MSELRAPRLTDNRLADLDLVHNALDSEIEYLDDALTRGLLTKSLHAPFTERRDALKRGQAWIAGKVAAERARREDA